MPKGFEELIRYLDAEPALRQRFFSRLQMLFFAGAGMAQHVFDALDRLRAAGLRRAGHAS